MFTAKKKITGILVMVTASLFLAIGMVTGPAAAQSVQQGTHHPTTQVILAPGADLTVDELRDMMGIQTWKFDVTLPPNAHHVIISLQRRNKSGKWESVGEAAKGDDLDAVINPDTPHRLLIALIPTQKTSLAVGKVRVWVDGFDRFNTWTVDTPLKEEGYMSLNTPQQLPDGSFAILGGFTHAPVADKLENADTIVALKIEIKDR
jgi:hypothetical protein